jgi:hypothetical protein
VLQWLALVRNASTNKGALTFDMSGCHRHGPARRIMYRNGSRRHVGIGPFDGSGRDIEVRHLLDVDLRAIGHRGSPRWQHELSEGVDVQLRVFPFPRLSSSQGESGELLGDGLPECPGCAPGMKVKRLRQATDNAKANKTPVNPRLP